MKRILIADDDPGILDALTALLSGRYEVVAARNGEDVLGEVERQRFDLVLLDLRLPLAEGERIVTWMRARSLTTPVLVMSANWFRLERALGLGADDALPKPFLFRELAEKIERLIGDRRSTRASSHARPA